jgi:DMSO/TMAO reductase YedYZ molybdopterin-dependent catalytic subunit
MSSSGVTRRDVLRMGGAAAASLATFSIAGPASAFPRQAGDEVIPWLDQPAMNPVPDVIGTQLVWEGLTSWLTPTEEFFTIKHYNLPAIDVRNWKLDLTGLVDRPRMLSLDEIRARPRAEVTFTLECSGNSAFPFNPGLIGNARWAGTPLAAVLQEAGIQAAGKEVVFFGTDAGEEMVRAVKITETFARSMSVEDAMNEGALLCYEMNGEPLTPAHGFPVRLIVPGWYGVANVKWLARIEVLDTRYAGKFMGRDYVTLREEQRDGQTVWTFTSVTKDRLKSAPAKVTRAGGHYTVMGAAWGAAIAGVEVKIDEGPWLPATVSRNQESDVTWAFWTRDWGMPAAGEHTITSRAIDTGGQVQPAMDDPRITKKLTYWEANGQITRRVRIP